MATCRYPVCRVSSSTVPRGLLLLRRALLPALLRRRPSLIPRSLRRPRRASSAAAAAAAAAVGHGRDVRAVLERLVEVADAARDILVAVDGEGDDGLREGEQRLGVSVWGIFCRGG